MKNKKKKNNNNNNLKQNKRSPRARKQKEIKRKY